LVLLDSAKSAISPNAQSVDVFQYVFNKLIQGTLSEFIEIWHEGRCGKCGRQLTVPSSIESGIGPECSKMLAKTSNKSIARDKKIDEILS